MYKANYKPYTSMCITGRGPPCRNPIGACTKTTIVWIKETNWFNLDLIYHRFCIETSLLEIYIFQTTEQANLNPSSLTLVTSPYHHWLKSPNIIDEFDWFVWFLFTTLSILCLPNTVRYHTFTQSSWFVEVVISLCSGTWSWRNNVIFQIPAHKFFWVKFWGNAFLTFECLEA